MPPPAAPDALPLGSRSSLGSLAPLRFERCRCAEFHRPEGLGASAVALAVPYRRCPVGVIADVDCPEFVGARCAVFVDRGPAPGGIVSEAEVAARAAELARDYLTPRYLRRVARLRDATTAHESGPTDAPGAASQRRGGTFGAAPLNIPADRSDRPLDPARRAPSAAPVGTQPPPNPTETPPRHGANPTGASSGP